METVVRREKWLALHNFRSNSEVFKQQLQPLIALLGDVDIEFVNAPHRARGPGFYPGDGFEWWYSPTYKSAMMGWIGDLGLEESKEHLRKIIEEKGPFDGVIGFSQGGGMAHFLLGQGIVKKGILFSPVVPLGHTLSPIINSNVLVALDPADFTGEAVPLDGIPQFIHSENHAIPDEKNEIWSDIEKSLKGW